MVAWRPKILVTRAGNDAAEFSAALEQAGFEAVEVPLLQREPIEMAVAMSVAAGPYDWVLLTSAAAAMAFAEQWSGPVPPIAAVGPKTAARLRELGLEVALVPSDATGARLVDAMGHLTGRRVLYARAEDAEPSTLAALRGTGADVVEAVVYRNIEPHGTKERLRAVWPVDVITLFSGSAARRLKVALDGLDGGVPVVAIGPTTADVARAMGFTVAAVADPHTAEGVVDALEAWWPTARSHRS